MREQLKTLTVDEYTSPDPITVHRDTPLKEVLVLMRKNSIRHLPVVEQNRPIGIISDRDVSLVKNLEITDQLTAASVMTPEPYTVSASASLEEVTFTMSSRKVGSAIVVDKKGAVYGIFTSTDALNALVEILRGEV